MSRTNLRIAYDGPALAEGRMDVRDLAPALLAIGELCDEAYRALHGEEHRIRVDVRADFKKGSFGIDLELAGLWNQIVTLFSGDTASALANLIEILGFGGGAAFGLVHVIRKAAGRPSRRTTRNADGTVTLEFDGGDQVTISSDLARLFADVRVRNSLAAAVAPLLRDGIDRFETRDSEGNVLEAIVKGEVVYFSPPEVIDAPPPVILDVVQERAFGLVSVVFKDDNKWRLSDAGGAVSAHIEDREFLERIDRREVSFFKGDTLVCDVRVQTAQTSKGPETQYTIIRVKQLLHAPRQVALELPPPNK